MKQKIKKVTNCSFYFSKAENFSKEIVSKFKKNLENNEIFSSRDFLKEVKKWSTEKNETPRILPSKRKKWQCVDQGLAQVKIFASREAALQTTATIGNPAENRGLIELSKSCGTQRR